MIDSTKNTLTLITGGVRSGKSAYAQKQALQYPPQRLFLATAEPLDDEMVQRIDRHQQERGDEFTTIEEPLSIHDVLSDKNLFKGAYVLVVDCITLWMNNLMHYYENDHSQIDQQLDLFLDTLIKRPCAVLVVTNEVGLGVMPVNALARQYSDRLGRFNQRLAAISDQVIFMVSGRAMVLPA